MAKRIGTEVEITIDGSRLTGMLGALIDELDVQMPLAMLHELDLVTVDAKTRAPSKTSALSNSIMSGDPTGRFSDGTLQGVVSSSLPYALHVEYGTKPHIIEPKADRASFGPNQSGFNAQNTKRGKRALRWAGGGGADGWIFAKRVKHPGTAAKPYLRPALEANRAAIIERFGKATQLAIIRARKAASKG